MPSSNTTILPPTKNPPAADWPHLLMWERINDLIYALPNYFETELLIKGINVTDIFSIGSVLSTIVETQVVEILNRLRNIWDPENQYSSYAFVKQSQTFPDVLLRHVENESDILFGIELKSWYVLSKEGQPSFRYRVTPDACASADLLVIVPWILSEVISGSPGLLSSYKELAKYAAQYRNYHWQTSRLQRDKDSTITSPPEANRHPYPDSKKEASDKAAHDKGNNFGRIARSGLINDYVAKIKSQDYLGITLNHWVEFFKAISETSTDRQISEKIESLKKKILAQSTPATSSKEEQRVLFLQMLNQLEELWDNLA